MRLYQDPKHEMTIAIEKYYKNLMKFIQFFCSMRRFFEVMKSSGFPFRIHLNGNFGNVPADFKFGSCDKFDIVIFNILVLTRFHQSSSDTDGIPVTGTDRRHLFVKKSEF